MLGAKIATWCTFYTHTHSNHISTLGKISLACQNAIKPLPLASLDKAPTHHASWNSSDQCFDRRVLPGRGRWSTRQAKATECNATSSFYQLTHRREFWTPRREFWDCNSRCKNNPLYQTWIESCPHHCNWNTRTANKVVHYTDGQKHRVYNLSVGRQMATTSEIRE